jgi:transposase
MTDTGERLETVRISNDPEYLRQAVARAGERPEVVLEATHEWHWAADSLAELGTNVHLAHPLGVKMFSYRRVKNDERDAADLADLLRMGRLPEACDGASAGSCPVNRPGMEPPLNLGGSPE